MEEGQTRRDIVKVSRESIVKAIEDVLGEQQAELARIERLAATIPTLRRNIACLLRTIEIISTGSNDPLQAGEGKDMGDHGRD